MTIKKIQKPTVHAAVPKPTEGGDVPEMPASPATGTGATIADRFKLDAPEVKTTTRGTVNKTAAAVALFAGVAALVVAGVLTYVMYGHWQFLMPM